MCFRLTSARIDPSWPATISLIGTTISAAQPQRAPCPSLHAPRLRLTVDKARQLCSKAFSSDGRRDERGQQAPGATATQRLGNSPPLRTRSATCCVHGCRTHERADLRSKVPQGGQPPSRHKSDPEKLNRKEKREPLQKRPQDRLPQE